MTNSDVKSPQWGEPNVGQSSLYDQTDNPGANATDSQNFETANDAFDHQLADDFVVPAGGWNVGEVDVGGVYFNGPGPATSVNVIFYADAGGLPGAAVPGGRQAQGAVEESKGAGARADARDGLDHRPE